MTVVNVLEPDAMLDFPCLLHSLQCSYSFESALFQAFCWAWHILINFFYKVTSFINVWAKKLHIQEVYQKVENLQKDMVFDE